MVAFLDVLACVEEFELAAASVKAALAESGKVWPEPID